MAGGSTITGDMFKSRVAEAVRSLGVVPRKVRYGTVYGGEKEASAFSFHDETHLVISVWQAVGGTVDEKFPFLFENATDQATYDTVFIVVGGDGASKGAMRWLETAVNDWNEASRHPVVMLFDSSDEFRGFCQRWAARGEMD